MNSRALYPYSPGVIAWLATMRPEAELATRYALRALFPELNDDREFTARMLQLIERISADSQIFSAIANRAIELEAMASAPWSADSEGIDTIPPARHRSSGK
jgi:hypothetical protein